MRERAGALPRAILEISLLGGLNYEPVGVWVGDDLGLEGPLVPAAFAAEGCSRVLGKRKSVSEGVYTAKIVAKLAADLKLDMPICLAVNSILHEGASVDSAIHDLLARPFSEETF